MNALEFMVPGVARPKARPRFSKGRIYTDDPTAKWEATVRAYALQATGTWARSHGERWPLDAHDYAVSMVFAGQNRADIDNLAKAVLDACNEVLYDDDKRIATLLTSRVLDDAAALYVRVTASLRDHPVWYGLGWPKMIATLVPSAFVPAASESAGYAP
ncbi:MAG: RusA family crossover junction endodeoxyribonuclease [Acidobacteria bacterium Pan2503]|uniref:RusA family crossover junction endodeoxyribonuclease n=1 Tax=Candidatus Acidiferrum panamense TaxID=2741543 RepID=A0A7V8NTW7_9BACT|nr:RusA family crossover junction endodeoxyribonuclease [Candidatus Acidoferrum panamensis]